MEILLGKHNIAINNITDSKIRRPTTSAFYAQAHTHSLSTTYSHSLSQAHTSIQNDWKIWLARILYIFILVENMWTVVYVRVSIFFCWLFLFPHFLRIFHSSGFFFAFSSDSYICAISIGGWFVLVMHIKMW